MKKIEVVAAIIKDGDRYFATQRGYGEFKGGWEFPGGKMEIDETPEAALIREIKEELDVDIQVDQFVCMVQHQYPSFFLTMHCFLCTLLDRNIILREHEDAKWLHMSELDSVDWLPADIEVVEKVKRLDSGELN